MKFEYPDLVHAAESTYIDPINCGSTVSYKITSTTYFDATIDLTDCNRKITWSFDADPEGLVKVDRAIEALVKFRSNLVKASKRWEKLKAEEKKFKELNKKNPPPVT